MFAFIYKCTITVPVCYFFDAIWLTMNNVSRSILGCVLWMSPYYLTVFSSFAFKKRIRVEISDKFTNLKTKPPVRPVHSLPSHSTKLM